MPEQPMTEAAGPVDAGEPLYVIVDENGKHLSHHRTSDGAEKLLPQTPGATGIDKTLLYY